MKLCIPVYEGVNLLDVAGPLEMFFWAGQRNPLDTILVTADGNAVTSINGVKFEAQGRFSEATEIDILWVPGGDVKALEDMMRNPDSPYLKYIKQVSTSATWVCSVCEGAMLLARAGLLDGYTATTHWAFVDCLRRFPKINVDATRQRYVVSGNRLTGGGISSGLDESLALVSLLFGEDEAKRVQRTTEYFPRPPVSGELPGTPSCQMSWE